MSKRPPKRLRAAGSNPEDYEDAVSKVGAVEKVREGRYSAAKPGQHNATGSELSKNSNQSFQCACCLKPDLDRRNGQTFTSMKLPPEAQKALRTHFRKQTVCSDGCVPSLLELRQCSVSTSEACAEVVEI